MLNQAPSPQELEQLVHEHIRQILEEKPSPITAEITAERRLADLGLTSLDLAQLVAALEIALQADPFQELVPITSVRTVGDLSSAYVKFFSGTADTQAQSDALLASQRRAQARRDGR